MRWFRCRDVDCVSNEAEDRYSACGQCVSNGTVTGENKPKCDMCDGPTVQCEENDPEVLYITRDRRKKRKSKKD